MLAVSEGRVAQLNRVADYGSAGYRFESCRDHEKPLQITLQRFFVIHRRVTVISV